MHVLFLYSHTLRLLSNWYAHVSALYGHTQAGQFIMLGSFNALSTGCQFIIQRHMHILHKKELGVDGVCLESSVNEQGR